ncbi:helix-turn-helix domain-containing protein [Alishewanella sp. HL-SH06]|jgi:putative transcriptional regulator|uniref:helix-turn-helix domain-containing protein n=1 Tax=Alishewanella sp. HL-SH06 TaxID=3461144 RepID=UPI004041004C
MLRYKVRELLAEKSFVENRRITFKELCDVSGVSRQTLTRMVNQRGYITGTDTLDKLCAYFNCGVGEVLEFVPNDRIDNTTLPAK